MPRGEEGDQRGDLVHGPEAPDRDPTHEIARIRDHRRVDERRGQRVGRDAELRVLVGDRLHEGHDTGLARRVGCDAARSAGLARARADPDDSAVARLAHRRKGPARAQEGAGQVDGHRPVPQLPCRLLERDDREDTGIEDEHARGAQLRLDPREGRLHGRLVAHVADDPQDARVGGRLQVQRCDLRAIASEDLRDPLADPPTGACHDGHSATQPLDLDHSLRSS